jgi:PAS domain-containing protein
MVLAVRWLPTDQGQLGLTLRGRTASGSTAVSLTSGPVRLAAGSELGRVTAMRDVEEEVTTRNALAELDRRYRLVALNATDMVVMVDLAGVFTWVSPATRQVLGYHPTELIGTDGGHLIHPEDTAMVQDMRDRIAHGEEAIS